MSAGHKHNDGLKIGVKFCVFQIFLVLLGTVFKLFKRTRPEQLKKEEFFLETRVRFELASIIKHYQVVKINALPPPPRHQPHFCDYVNITQNKYITCNLLFIYFFLPERICGLYSNTGICQYLMDCITENSCVVQAVFVLL
jgi:hypothetical protein